MSRLEPIHKGLIWAAIAITAMTACFALVLRSAAYPSPTLFRELAQVGVGLLIAYSVAIAAAEKTLSGSQNHENWLGFVVGVGLCGLLAVVFGLGLAEHRAAGHANFLDELGLWWVLSSIGLLGLFVALLPYVTYSWRKGT